MNPALSTRLRPFRARRDGALKFELIAVLAVKAALLLLLKTLFFSHPAAEDMRMPPAAVAQALLETPVSAGGARHDR
jgi:hypothetical protein